MKARITAGLALIAFLSVGAAPPAPIPHPEEDQLGPGVREEVAAARSLIDRSTPDGAPDIAAEAWGTLARIYHAHGFREAALGAYRQARALDPGGFDWIYLLGVLHQERGELEESRDLLRSALRIRPGDRAVRFRLAEVERLRGDLPSSHSLATDLLHEEPGLAAVHALAGRIASDRGDWHAAARHFLRALELDPSADRLHYPLGLALRQAGDLEAARRHLGLAGTGEPRMPDPVVASLERTGAGARLADGARALRAGDPATAERAFREAVAVDPDNASAHRGLANALLRQDRPAEALDSFRRVAELSPEDPVALADIGVALLRLGRAEEAVEPLRRASESAPEEPIVRTRYGQALVAAGRTDEAVDELREAVRLDPSYLESHRALGRALLAAGRPDEGIEVLRPTLGRPPDDPSAFLQVARAQALLERLPAAGETLRAAEEDHPRDTAIMAANVRFFASAPQPDLRDPDHASAIARRLFELDPNPLHAQLVAMALAAQGRFEEAIRWQERIVSDAVRAGAPPEIVTLLEGDLERYRRGESAAFSF